jgi:hypothetical protein
VENGKIEWFDFERTIGIEEVMVEEAEVQVLPPNQTSAERLQLPLRIERSTVNESLMRMH